MQGEDRLLALFEDGVDLESVPTKVLEASISSYAGRMAASMARWLSWIAVFDRREGWFEWGQQSCAGWLNWKCGVDTRTAREQVRVARALEHLPLIQEVFAAGELSYSKVRALTRVANEFNEGDLVEVALHTTASQLERTCRKLADKDPAVEWSPSVVFESCGDHGRIVITVPIDEYQRAKQATLAASEQVVDDAVAATDGGHSRREVVDGLGGVGAVRATVAASLMSGALDRPEGPFDDAIVVVDACALRDPDSATSPEALPTGAGNCVDPECSMAGEAIPPLVARRITCDARLQVGLDEGGDVAMSLGREQRVVSRHLRRLVMRRDLHMCRFPGCGVERGLHAHHVVHWADGGETELANLIALCPFHHTSVHEGGWSIMNKNGRFVFYDPAGHEAVVPRLRDVTGGAIEPERTPVRRRATDIEPLAGTGERMDFDYVVDILVTSAEARRRRAEVETPKPHTNEAVLRNRAALASVPA